MGSENMFAKRLENVLCFWVFFFIFLVEIRTHNTETNFTSVDDGGINWLAFTSGHPLPPPANDNEKIIGNKNIGENDLA